MSEHRLARVERQLIEELSAILMREEIKDPRVSPLISFSHAKVAKDLAYARVWVSGYLSRNELDNAVEALNHAAGFLQGKLGKLLKYRSTPKLTFVVDHSIEEGYEMIQRIKEANQ
ncbi:MAG: 30S ribosome-binding factor RbfA [Alkalispirochaetaceae bacterium]